MVRITENLIRQRAEHNECIISTLEEISLHQQDIERIEYLDKWCCDLKILYLQSNLIPKIENVGRLKKVEYINLALNNVERIENLEGCESLKKLDLTVNFVGELTTVETLKGSYNLRELFLTGNPCTEYVDYRDYVIAALPQLQYLDGVEIEKSERIMAMQRFFETRPSIIQQQLLYRKKRQKQKEEAEMKKNGTNQKSKSDGTRWYTDTQPCSITELGSDEEEAIEKSEEDKDKEFWEEKVAFTPESRIAVHEHMQEKRRREERKDEKPPAKERTLITPDGRVFNVNEAKVDFTLTEDNDNQALLLDVAVFKHMDTSLCDVDVQPSHVKVTLKGQVLQLVLPEEVNADSSTAKRSQITGHLLITMPKAKPVVTAKKTITKKNQKNKENENTASSEKPGRERLEVDPSAVSGVDITNIVKEKPPVQPFGSHIKKSVRERPNSEDFIDDPDVPPLE